jgi:hypothetical protein
VGGREPVVPSRTGGSGRLIAAATFHVRFQPRRSSVIITFTIPEDGTDIAVDSEQVAKIRMDPSSKGRTFIRLVDGHEFLVQGEYVDVLMSLSPPFE